MHPFPLSGASKSSLNAINKFAKAYGGDQATHATASMNSNPDIFEYQDPNGDEASHYTAVEAQCGEITTSAFFSPSPSDLSSAISNRAPVSLNLKYVACTCNPEGPISKLGTLCPHSAALLLHISQNSHSAVHRDPVLSIIQSLSDKDVRAIFSKLLVKKSSIAAETAYYLQENGMCAGEIVPPSAAAAGRILSSSAISSSSLNMPVSMEIGAEDSSSLKPEAYVPKSDLFAATAIGFKTEETIAFLKSCGDVFCYQPAYSESMEFSEEELPLPMESGSASSSAAPPSKSEQLSVPQSDRTKVEESFVETFKMIFAALDLYEPSIQQEIGAWHDCSPAVDILMSFVNLMGEDYAAHWPKDANLVALEKALLTPVDKMIERILHPSKSFILESIPAQKHDKVHDMLVYYLHAQGNQNLPYAQNLLVFLKHPWKDMPFQAVLHAQPLDEHQGFSAAITHYTMMANRVRFLLEDNMIEEAANLCTAIGHIDIFLNFMFSNAKSESQFLQMLEQLMTSVYTKPVLYSYRINVSSDVSLGLNQVTESHHHSRSWPRLAKIAAILLDHDYRKIWKERKHQRYSKIDSCTLVHKALEEFRSSMSHLDPLFSQYGRSSYSSLPTYKPGVPSLQSLCMAKVMKAAFSPSTAMDASQTPDDTIIQRTFIREMCSSVSNSVGMLSSHEIKCSLLASVCVSSVLHKPQLLPMIASQFFGFSDVVIDSLPELQQKVDQTEKDSYAKLCVEIILQQPSLTKQICTLGPTYDILSYIPGLRSSTYGENSFLTKHAKFLIDSLLEQFKREDASTDVTYVHMIVAGRGLDRISFVASLLPQPAKLHALQTACDLLKSNSQYCSNEAILSIEKIVKSLKVQGQMDLANSFETALLTLPHLLPARCTASTIRKRKIFLSDSNSGVPHENRYIVFATSTLNNIVTRSRALNSQAHLDTACKFLEANPHPIVLHIILSVLSEAETAL